MPKKKNYSYAERKAYYVGVGAGIGHHRKHGSVIKSMQGKVKESFKNGLDCGLSNLTKTVAKINKKVR